MQIPIIADVTKARREGEENEGPDWSTIESCCANLTFQLSCAMHICMQPS